MPVSIMDEFEVYIRTELYLSHETFSAYTRDVKEFLNFIGANELTVQSIEKFISHLKRRGLKPTTVRRKCMSVRCLCRHLISLGRLDQNILATIDSVRINRRIPDALEPEDVDTLVSAVRKRVPLRRTTNVRRDVAIILTLYHSGLRASELCGLNLPDVNLSNRMIKVSGKGGRERMVPTTISCTEAIQIYLDLDRQSDTNAVFVKANGQRITRRAVSDMLLSLSCAAGVKHTTAHMLRRTCATELMNRGMEIESVQALLGHRHISTTQDYLATDIDRLKIVHEKCHPFGVKHEIQQN